MGKNQSRPLSLRQVCEPIQSETQASPVGLIGIVEVWNQARQCHRTVDEQPHRGRLGQHRFKRVGSSEAQGLINRAWAQVDVRVAPLRSF